MLAVTPRKTEHGTAPYVDEMGWRAGAKKTICVALSRRRPADWHAQSGDARAAAGPSRRCECDERLRPSLSHCDDVCECVPVCVHVHVHVG